MAFVTRPSSKLPSWRVEPCSMNHRQGGQKLRLTLHRRTKRSSPKRRYRPSCRPYRHRYVGRSRTWSDRRTALRNYSCHCVDRSWQRRHLLHPPRSALRRYHRHRWARFRHPHCSPRVCTPSSARRCCIRRIGCFGCKCWCRPPGYSRRRYQRPGRTRTDCRLQPRCYPYHRIEAQCRPPVCRCLLLASS